MGQLKVPAYFIELSQLTNQAKPILEAIDHLLTKNETHFYVVGLRNGATFLWRNPLWSPKPEDYAGTRSITVQ